MWEAVLRQLAHWVWQMGSWILLVRNTTTLDPEKSLIRGYTESGETMKAAGLKAIDTVIESTASLIKSKRPSNPKLVYLIAQRINGVISMLIYFSSQVVFLCLTNQIQRPKNTCSANIISVVRNSRRQLKSHLASEHLPSLH